MTHANVVDGPGQAVAAIPEGVLCALAYEMSLGLDCHVPLATYTEAAECLVRQLVAHGWSITPPASDLHS